MTIIHNDVDKLTNITLNEKKIVDVGHLFYQHKV